VARPSLLTDELREQIELELADGVPVTVAAASAGISKRTLHSWLEQGRVVRRPRLRLVDAVPAEPVGSSVEPSERSVEKALVATIMRAAQHDWHAAAFLLRWRGQRARRRE
jgi:hypothetical protein